MKKRLIKIVELATDYPKTVMALCVILTVVFALQIPKIRIDTDPENMLSPDEPVRVQHTETKKEFSLYDVIVVGILDESTEEGVFKKETLERIARITEEIQRIDGVVGDDILSLLTTDDIDAAGGMLTIKPLLEAGADVDPEWVKERALKNPLLKGVIVSEDGKLTSIYVPIERKDQSYRISQEIGSIIDKYKGTEEYHITGLPVAEDTFGVEMFKEMTISAPLAGLLIFLLMLFFFRSVVRVTSAMIVALMSVIWAMGLLIGTGFTVHIMSSMIPVFLMPIAVVDSIHILSEFHDRYSPDKGVKATLLEVMDELFIPMLFTSITSAAGFLSLITTPIPPVRVFGAFVAFGILVAWLLTITFIPAWLMLTAKKMRLKRTEHATSSFNGILQRAGRFTIRYSRPIIAGAVVVFLASVYFITFTVVNDNPVKWFAEGHPIRIADKVLNKHFGGTYMAYLVLDGKREGAFKDPEVMGYLERLSDELNKLDVVGKTISVADVVKKISFELYEEDPAYNRLPDSAKKISQYLFLYEMAGDPEDLFHLVTPSYSKANLWVQLKSGDNMDMQKVVQFVEDYMKKNPPPEELGHSWAGLTYLNMVWQEKMVSGMIKALTGGAITVLIMMVILFRSVIWGLIAVVPLTLTIVFIYGLVGITGKDYDMPIAVLSSLTLGVSVDFAIHFVGRTREFREAGYGWNEIVSRMFGEPVRAIIKNMFVVAVGFMPLLFSVLVPYRTVGFFFASIMVTSGVATLILLPAIMNTLKRRLKLEEV